MTVRSLASFAAYSLIIPALLLPSLILDWPGALPLGVRIAAFAVVWLLSAMTVLIAWPSLEEDAEDDHNEAPPATTDTTTRSQDAGHVDFWRVERSGTPA